MSHSRDRRDPPPPTRRYRDYDDDGERKVYQGRMHYERDAARGGRRDAGARPFPEKSDYKPEVELNYVDETGRELNPKEAYRFLSWKFHGKRPGKKQLDKYQLRRDRKDMVKKKEGATAEALSTLEKQREKQEQFQTPYIILSGAGKHTQHQLHKD